MTKTGVNNLSQQLCELCGIEPKIGICDRELNPGDYSGTCGFENPTETECKDCTCWHEDLVVYPDFAKSENFVRLLFLPMERQLNDGKTALVNMVDGSWGNQTDFLTSLLVKIKRLPKEYNYDKLFKQTIASEEWEY